MDLLLWPLFVLATVIVLAILIFMRVRGGLLWKRLALGPAVSTSTVDPGQHVCVQGAARAPSLITAPASGMQVIAYRLVVRERREKSGATVILETSDAASFALLDEEGEVTVNAAGAQLLLFEKKTDGFLHKSLDDDDEADLRVRDLVKRRGRVIYGTYDWTEYQLPQDGRALVDGWSKEEVMAGGAAPDYRVAPTRPVLAGGPSRALLISDRHFDELRRSVKELLGSKAVPQQLLKD
jgi:hypothetical protein